MMYNDFFETVHTFEVNPAPPPLETCEHLNILNKSQVDWKIEPSDLANEWHLPEE